MGENLNKKKNTKLDLMTVGFALFAMFFGAGNLIFPPEIGITAGPKWWIGAICFIIADAGLALLALFSLIKYDGDIEKVTGTIGRVPGNIINSIMILCIGCLVATPRTAATTFELGYLPVTGSENSKLALAIFSVVFFAIVLVLTIRPNKVVDIVGKILTPVLLITLAIIIIIGIVAPAADIQPAMVDSTVKDGIANGYQTLDGMAALFFGIIIISSIRDKGYTDKAEEKAMAGKAGALAGILLALVYGGLAYLGASTGQLWHDEAYAQLMSGTGIDRAALLTNIAQELVGRPGVIILGVIVAFACLTTAIGLVSATSDFFSKLSNGKLSYSMAVILNIIVCVLVCNLGLSKIVAFAAPILVLVYPPVIVLFVLSYLSKEKFKRNVYVCTTLFAFVVSLIQTFCDTFGMESLSWIHKLPLDVYGFGWVIPAIVGFIVGMLIPGPTMKEVEDKRAQAAA